MLLAFGALAAGIIILIFSADKFVEGAAVVAKRLGLPSILIGMLVIGFGSSCAGNGDFSTFFLSG